LLAILIKTIAIPITIFGEKSIAITISILHLKSTATAIRNFFSNIITCKKLMHHLCHITTMCAFTASALAVDCWLRKSIAKMQPKSTVMSLAINIAIL